MKKQKSFWIRENRSVGVMTFLMSLVSCYYIYEFRMHLNELWETLYASGPNVNDSAFTNAFTRYLSTADRFYKALIIFVLILTFLLFHNISSQKAKEWIGSLPLKNEDMYWYKLRQGVIAYTIPVVLFAIGCSFLMVNNRGWMVDSYLLTEKWSYLISQESIQHYLIVAGMLWLWLTACYAIFFFAQCICRNGVVGLLLGLGMVNVTRNFGLLMYLLQYNVNGKIVSARLSFLGERFYRCYMGIFSNKSMLEDGTYFGTIFEHMEGTVTYHVHWYEFVVIAVTLVVTWIFSYHYFKKMNQPGIEGLFASGLMRAFVLWGFSVCMSADVFYLVVQLMSFDNMSLRIYLAVIPISIVLAVILHLLCKRRGY